MTNTISLSTDMTKLYLILDSGLPQEFSLAGNGVFITSIFGNVHVVAASVALAKGSDELSIATVAQWDAAFHKNTNQLAMIGNDDMEVGVTAEIKKSDLSNGNVVNLRLDSTGTKILIRTS